MACYFLSVLGQFIGKWLWFEQEYNLKVQVNLESLWSRITDKRLSICLLTKAFILCSKFLPTQCHDLLSNYHVFSLTPLDLVGLRVACVDKAAKLRYLVYKRIIALENSSTKCWQVEISNWPVKTAADSSKGVIQILALTYVRSQINDSR